MADIPKGSVVNPKLMEAWFRLMAEAMRGTSEAQEAVNALPKMATATDEWRRWLARFLPAATADVQPEAFEEWLEDWWRMMGVTPRSRYLELLERHERLRSRLERAEETIHTLRSEVGSREPEVETRRVLDLWEKMLKESLQAQSEWMRTWSAGDTADQNEAVPGAAEDDEKNNEA